MAIYVCGQFAAANEVHDQIKFFLRLESILHIDDERGRDIRQDLALGHHMLKLIILHDEFFLKYFHRIVFFKSSQFLFN